MKVVKELFFIVTGDHFKDFVRVSVPLLFLELADIHSIVKVIDGNCVGDSACKIEK